MSGFLELVRDRKVQHFNAGEVVIEQGTPMGALFVLLEGEVEVLRDKVRVAGSSETGVVFGEMSVLLNVPHTATVRARTHCSFAVIENPREFLEKSSQASMYLAELLANRLDALSKYLIDVKRQYAGHDHIGMVDEVLETLMHRQKKKART